MDYFHSADFIGILQGVIMQIMRRDNEGTIAVTYSDVQK